MASSTALSTAHFPIGSMWLLGTALAVEHMFASVVYTGRAPREEAGSDQPVLAAAEATEVARLGLARDRRARPARYGTRVGYGYAANRGRAPTRVLSLLKPEAPWGCRALNRQHAQRWHILRLQRAERIHHAIHLQPARLDLLASIAPHGRRIGLITCSLSGPHTFITSITYNSASNTCASYVFEAKGNDK